MLQKLPVDLTRFRYDEAAWKEVKMAYPKSRQNVVSPRRRSFRGEELEIRFWLEQHADGYLENHGTDPNEHARARMKHLAHVAKAAEALLTAIKAAERVEGDHFLGDHFPEYAPLETDRMLEHLIEHRKVTGYVEYIERLTLGRASGIKEILKQHQNNSFDYHENDYLRRVRDVWVNDFGGRTTGRPATRFLVAATTPVLRLTKSALTTKTMERRLERMAERDRQTGG